MRRPAMEIMSGVTRSWGQGVALVTPVSAQPQQEYPTTIVIMSSMCVLPANHFLKERNTCFIKCKHAKYQRPQNNPYNESTPAQMKYLGYRSRQDAQ